MQDTILSTKLLDETLNHYNDCKNKSFVVNPSLPILFFGDLKSFSKQNFKVVTAALNPSDKEFRRGNDENYSFYRFPDFKNTINSLEKSLSNYFKINPYTNWFDNSYEPFLNGLDCSYYSDKFSNVAVHTDICSPIATNPTWSRLYENEKEELLDKGFELWKKLIFELKPDLIVLSVAKIYLNQLSPTFIHKIAESFKGSSGKTRKTPYNLNLFKVNVNGYETKLVYGPAGLKPFQKITHKLKYEMGRKTLNLEHKNLKYKVKSYKEIIHKPTEKSQNKLIMHTTNEHIEFSFTRLKVTQEMYNILKTTKGKNLKIIVLPKKGRHPKGKYIIPYFVALDFIESKQNSYNWDKNQNFHQDAIPTVLRNYFSYD